MTTSRIVGYVMARDEWPRLALAITHALANHVDHVLVLDHASTDETATGLGHLERAWPGRLSVYRLDDPDYSQEAATALMARVGRFAEHEWVYVFDADEYLLAPRGQGLRDILADVPPDVDAVRYEVHNWVAPSTFDDADLARYDEIRYRARPNIFAEVPGEILADEIERGNMNYFDARFESKIIMRGHRASWIKAGAHDLKHTQGVHEIDEPASRLRAAHLPLPSRRQVALKSRHGQALIDSHLPRSHGWQNQMLRRMEQSGRLDDFWASHSIPADGEQGVSNMPPTTEPDGALAEALEPSIKMLIGEAEEPSASCLRHARRAHTGTSRLRGTGYPFPYRTSATRRQRNGIR